MGIWQNQLYSKLYHSECKSGYFDNPIEIEYTDNGIQRKMADHVSLKGDKIIACGQRCPQVQITNEETCQKMFYAFIPATRG